VRMVNDAERAPKPVMTVKECFEHSSNVGMSKLAYQTFATQPDHFLNYLHKFHFDAKTGVDLVGEERPVLPKIKRNKEGMSDMITMAFGYAIEVTPLQTLMLYNAVANNGTMMKPYLVNRIQNNGLAIKEFSPQVVEEKIAELPVIKAAQECMLAVTTDGTGKKAMQGALYRAGGKTGTAHVAGKNIGYDDGIYQASFVGYFPFDKPKYSCIVVIKTKPHPAKHMGGEVSAPVFREIADKLYSSDTLNNSILPAAGLKKDSTIFYYSGTTKDMKQVMQTLNVAYTDSASKSDWGRLYAGSSAPILNRESLNRQVVPDVKGMGLKDALYLLENMNMKVMAKGKGKVKLQSIEPGTALNKNQNIKLELN
jgi:cell division protein FtsI (penicillin-binding protein 3)